MKIPGAIAKHPRLWLAGFAALLVAAIASSCAREEAETVSPSRGRIVQAVYATGEVEPVYWARLSPFVQGRIASVLAEDGEEVKAGQKVLLMEDTVERAKAEEYRARLAFLDKEIIRLRALERRDVSSRRALEQAESDQGATRAMLRAQEELISRMALVSPIDGIVLRQDGEAGETVKPEDALVWVGAPSPLWVTAEVDEEDIPLIAPGQRALIASDAFPGEALEGKIREITPKGDPVSKSFRVRVDLPEKTPLKVGMTVEVNVIAREAENALLIPAQSVRDGTVWVAARGGAEPRRVTLGAVSGDRAEVLSGLGEGERILAKPPAQ